jgi:hypothetical protein
MKINKFCAFFFIVLSMLFYCEHCYAFSDQRFTDTTDKGNFGESVTDEFYKARGYEKLSTKHTGNQGIDCAYVKRNPDGTVQDIRVVESKTDSSPYNPEQMSDKTMNEQIEKMRRSNDPKVREDGELLLREKGKGKGKIKKELHIHDTWNGKLTIIEIKPNGEQGGVIADNINVKKIHDRLFKERERQKVNKISEGKSSGTPEGQVKEVVPIGIKNKNVLERIGERISNLASRLTGKIFGLLQNIGESISRFFGSISRRLSGASSVVTEKISSFAGRVMEKVSKVSGAVGERLSSFFRPIGKSILHYYRTAFDKMSKVLGSFATKSSGYSRKVFKQISRVPNFCKERISGTFGRIAKWSVAFGIIYSGYSITKEVYERAVEGQPVHPSRVIARAIVGFAGGSGGTLLFGTLLAVLFAVVFPPAVPVAGFIGGVLGCVLGGIISEWLFEIIMPLKGTGWTVSDFFIGGFFGSLIGIVSGVIIGKIFAEIRIAFRQKEKPKKKEKKTIWASLKEFFTPTVEDEIRSSFFGKGLWGGFLLGGFSMGLVFIYLFSFTTS